MSALVFVRHGQTEANRSGVLLGRLDAPLNGTGRSQIEAVAVRVAALQPTRVLSSPLVRAADSAAIIAEACGLAMEVDERLVEVDYGEYDGIVLGDLPADLVEQWRANPDFAPPGGESLASVQERVGRFCAEVLASVDGDGPVIAVSHVSPIKAAVCWALDVSPLRAWRMRLDNATTTSIIPGPEGPLLKTYNEV